MTVEHIQSLITDLDDLIHTDLSDKELIRPVLTRVRAYLVSVSQDQTLVGLTKPQETAIEQIVQGVINQLNDQLADWFDSLEQELAGLRQQRQSLHQEIYHLQQQHQQMISEFIQLLIRRSQEALLQQVNQTWEKMTQQLRLESSSLNSSDVLEHLLQLQQRSDQLLLNLDTTFRTVFETLEQDLQGYYESLSQGLERMHNLGQQGEAKLMAYVNRLAQQLEQPAEKIQTIAPKEETEPQEEEVKTIRLLTDLIEVQTPEEVPKLEQWYLGIDWGTYSLAAVLSKKVTSEGIIQSYPLYWSSEGGSTFRLPVTIGEQVANTGIGLDNLKMYLNESNCQPKDIEAVLVRLLTPFNPNKTQLSEEITVKTVDLSDEELQEALTHLDGVIFSIPTGWGQFYRDYLTQAVLKTELVDDGDKIMFVDEALATLFGHLADLTPSNYSRILVINSGATTTDLAVVKLPPDIQNLTPQDFSLSSVAYGGNTLDQDIFCQLIYPQWIAQLNPSLTQIGQIIPTPGHPDPQRRIELQKHLKTHPIGRSFLEAAKLAKLILQQQPEFSSQLGDQSWSVNRQDVEQKISGLFLEQLSQQMNLLLGSQNLSPLDIEQVIVSGGTSLALWYSLSPWLTQQFPQAVIIHDSETEILSRVANGLFLVPYFSE